MVPCSSINYGSVSTCVYRKASPPQWLMEEVGGYGRGKGPKRPIPTLLRELKSSSPSECHTYPPPASQRHCHDHYLILYVQSLFWFYILYGKTNFFFLLGFLAFWERHLKVFSASGKIRTILWWYLQAQVLPTGILLLWGDCPIHLRSLQPNLWVWYPKFKAHNPDTVIYLVQGDTANRKRRPKLRQPHFRTML